MTGKTVKIKMIEKSINQKQLCQKTKISRATLSLFLNGWRLLSDKHLKSIAKALDLDFKALCRGDVIDKSNIKKEDQIELFKGK